jgi:hypothetical protein
MSPSIRIGRNQAKEKAPELDAFHSSTTGGGRGQLELSGIARDLCEQGNQEAFCDEQRDEGVRGAKKGLFCCLTCGQSNE